MVISKKMKIIGFSMLGVAITTIAIAVPLSIKKSDDEKSLSVREKIIDLSKKEIIINENSDLNLSILASQTKIINEIKKRASFLNDTQKKSIKIKTKIGLVSYKEILKIEIIITLNKKEETFSFKFKRLINNYDRFDELSQQNQILSNETSNLDLSNSLKRNIVKKHLQKQASFLSDQEKLSIEIITKNKTIGAIGVQVIEVNAIFFKVKTKFVFKFLRKESNAEKNKNKNLYDSLKSKFDRINLTQTLSTQADLDLLNLANKNIVKDFIIGLINATASVDDVTNEEEKGITIDSSKTITHTNPINVNISITFGANTKTYIFELTRTKSQDEIDKDQVATIKAKIKDTNLVIVKDVDTSDDAEILAAIKAQLKIDNSTLSNSDLAKITDNISSLTPGTNTNVTLTITVSDQSDTINIIINRPFNDVESVTKAKEAINSLSTKEITISANSGTITTNKEAILNGLKDLSGYSALDLRGTTITIKNSSTVLTLSGISFTIVITKNSANTEITSGFTIKRSKNNNEINLDKFNALKTKIENVNVSQTLSDKMNLDLSNNLIQNKVKQFIFDKIDEANSLDKLNQKEKEAISLLTTNETIYLSERDIKFKITFDSNVKEYTFKLKRTINSPSELSEKTKHDTLLAKIKKAQAHNWREDGIAELKTKYKDLFFAFINKHNESKLINDEKEKIIIFKLPSRWAKPANHTFVFILNFENFKTKIKIVAFWNRD